MDAYKHMSRVAHLERYTNDRRFAQITKAFTARGVCTSIYAADTFGVMHRIDASTAHAVCGVPLLRQAKLVFQAYATCVRCACAA